MKTGNRYSLFRVFWVVLVVNLFFTMLGLIALVITPSSDSSSLEKILNVKTLLNTVTGIIFSTGFYYFSINAFYKLLIERKRASEFLKPVGLAVLSLIAYYTLTHLLFVSGKINFEFGESSMGRKLTIGLMIFSYTLSSLFFLGMSLLIAYLTSLRDDRKQRKVLEAQKMQLEIEKSQANFNFLKAQINPHFLHNTLNFLYAKSLPYSSELSEGILTLSEIMRYALSEGNARDGKAPLRDEIEHMRNVIKINQLRFSNQLHVQFDVEGVVNGSQIIPFILITLVENAFKHGDLKSNTDPIVIKLRIDGEKLYFYCRNRKKTGPKELSTGIGLDNIKKRLELAYGNQYELLVRDEAEFYTTELTIQQL